MIPKEDGKTTADIRSNISRAQGELTNANIHFDEAMKATNPFDRKFYLDRAWKCVEKVKLFLSENKA